MDGSGKDQEIVKIDPPKWPDLDLIVDKVTPPQEIYQDLVNLLGKNAPETSKVRYLTRLFFHFAGPSAFQQVGEVFSATCRSETLDFSTTGGRIRALDRINLAHPIEQRALLVALLEERARRQKHAPQPAQAPAGEDGLARDDGLRLSQVESQKSRIRPHEEAIAKDVG